jgi:hypothetical protein
VHTVYNFMDVSFKGILIWLPMVSEFGVLLS